MEWFKGSRKLEIINLSGNELHGSLPDSAFALLTNLQRLQLDHNNLNGSVPWFGHLENLGKNVS